MKPLINCSGCCDYCLDTECNYRKIESLTYTITQDDITKEPIKYVNKDRYVDTIKIEWEVTNEDSKS